MFGRERNRREKKKDNSLFNSKKKKENENDETQLAIFQQQNRPLYTEADVWGMLTEWNVIDPCMLWIPMHQWPKEASDFGVPPPHGTISSCSNDE